MVLIYGFVKFVEFQFEDNFIDMNKRIFIWFKNRFLMWWWNFGEVFDGIDWDFNIFFVFSTWISFIKKLKVWVWNFGKWFEIIYIIKVLIKEFVELFF